MSAHTPGPWRHAKAGRTDGGTVHAIYSPHNMVCTISAGIDVGNSDLIDSHCEANARLVAAAPDLLEELRNAQALLASHPSSVTETVRRVALARIATVVAKARG